jgi:hypothetical protein
MWSLRLISPFRRAWAGILSGESLQADFQYPDFWSFNRRDRFAFGRDPVRSDDAMLSFGD